MKIVIDVDDKKYDSILRVKNGIWGSQNLDSLEYAVACGIPLSKVLDSIRGEIEDKWEKMHRRWQRDEISDKQRTYQMYVYKEVCEILDKYGKEQK